MASPISDRLDQFDLGAAVEVSPRRIEAELSDLWRQAAREAQAAGKRPVSRACLWNLALFAPNALLEQAKRLIDGLAAQIPTRAIVMIDQGEGGAAHDESTVRTWVEANWQKVKGRRRSGSDEITIVTSGHGIRRLAALARALWVTDAPIAMVWWGPIPDAGDPALELLAEVDRLIIDTRKLLHPRDFLRCADLLDKNLRIEVVDCAWLGVRPLRGLLAALFDPPGDSTVLRELDTIIVRSGVRQTPARGLLFIAWLSHCLGWGGTRRVDIEGYKWTAVRASGALVSISLEQSGDGPNHGITEIELRQGNLTWQLIRDDNCVQVLAPGFPDRNQPIRSHTHAELVASALGPHGRDAIYRDVLRRVAELVGP